MQRAEKFSTSKLTRKLSLSNLIIRTREIGLSFGTYLFLSSAGILSTQNA